MLFIAISFLVSMVALLSWRVRHAIDFWAPHSFSPTGSREGRWLDVIGKLRPDVTIAQAQADFWLSELC